MKGGKRPGAGRKPVHIDLAELEKLCLLQCTDQDVAAFFGVDVRTIERRKKDPRFAATMQSGRAKGIVSLRRYLWTLAAKGNAPATIFLAKNLLGYKDSSSHQISGSDGGAVQVSIVEVLQQRRNRLAAEGRLGAALSSEKKEGEVDAQHR